MPTSIKSLIKCGSFLEEEKNVAFNILKQLDGLSINRAKEVLDECALILGYLIVEVGELDQKD